jgi:hypothetical protein
MILRRSPFLLLLLLVACQPAFLAAPLPTRATFPPIAAQPTPASTPTPEPSATSLSTETPLPTGTLIPMVTTTPARTSLPVSLDLDPQDWKHWPILPIVTERARLIYQIGQGLGNDPHAFSIFGDCQAEPDVFMGVYETDPAAVAALPVKLQETVGWFSGSFNRLSPTVKPATTTGALLWSAWHENKYTCTIYESPMLCELRIHKPSYVIIQVGTHYENRNADYMRKILDQLIKKGVVPILATKADNRELDDRVNTAYAALVVEYNLPFWNFWAAVDDLPNRGLYTRPDATWQGDLYLTATASAIHRRSALEALDAVRRAVTAP